LNFEIVKAPSADGRAIEFDVKVNKPEFFISQSVLGSVRSIRDWDVDSKKPSEIQEQATIDGHLLTLKRKSLDGSSFYEMAIKAEGAVLSKDKDGRIQFKAESAPVVLHVRCESADPRLRPLALTDIIKPEYLTKVDARTGQMLAFLFYKEKFMAGSWTYLTYFGRDTLLTMKLLLPALQPAAAEAMLGAVIDRLRADGDVAHEEAIGDYAAYMRLKDGEKASMRAVYDYHMVDDDFLLAAVMGPYLAGLSDHGAAFLARRTPDGKTYKEAIGSNLALIAVKSAPFAAHPEWKNLIAIERGRDNGNWRDSGEGLGRGRYPYDVNTALVPAALDGAATIYSLIFKDEGKAADARKAAKIWMEKAPPLFVVKVAAAEAKRRSEALAKALHLAAPAAEKSGVDFSGVSLDAAGKPVHVMNSDEGFRLAFTDPDEASLKRAAFAVTEPFPYGLRTPIGLMVANPAFADAKVQDIFDPSHYHGMVIWSWQQALMAAGLERQLARTDLSAATRATLIGAQKSIWEMIRATEKLRTKELWSWKAVDGKIVHVPFGQREADETEANPDQGWSHAYLALKPVQ
jgi:hypothetical protein